MTKSRSNSATRDVIPTRICNNAGTIREDPGKGSGAKPFIPTKYWENYEMEAERVWNGPQMEEKWKENALDGVDSILVVTEGALSSAHCYLLHSEETLCRLSGQSHKFELNPFSTPVLEQKDDEKKEDDASWRVLHETIPLLY